MKVMRGHARLAAAISVAAAALGMVTSGLVAMAPPAAAGTVNTIISTAQGEVGRGPCGGTSQGYYATGTGQSGPCGSGGWHAWCADFAAWDWQQADVLNINSDLTNMADSFVTYGQHNGTLHISPQNNSYQAQPGDVILYANPGDSKPSEDHVVIDIGNTSTTTDNTIGGNEGGGNGIVQEDYNMPNTVGADANAENPGAGNIVYAVISPKTSTSSSGAGDLVRFNRGTSGGWDQYDVTSIKSLDQVTTITEPFIEPNGNMSVMAINSAGDLVQFDHDGSTDTWSEYNVSSVNSLTKVTAITRPFFESNGNLTVMTISSGGDVVQFNRTSAGVWGVYNVTSTNGFAQPQKITEPFVDSSGILNMMTIGAGGDLVQLTRDTSGQWSRADISARNNLTGVQQITEAFTDQSNGDLAEVAISSGGDVVKFDRNSSGAWSFYNVTSANSFTQPQKITEPFFLSNGNLTVMAFDANGDLVQFTRGTSGWSWYDVSARNSITGVKSITAPFYESDGTTLTEMTISSGGDVVQFNRTSTGVWSVYNVTSTNGFTQPQHITEPFMHSNGVLTVMAIK